MDAGDVIEEAYPIWHGPAYLVSADQPIGEELSLRPQLAMDALKSVWNRTPDDPFWETVDWEQLEQVFIGFINERHQRLGLPDYEQEIAARQNLALQHSRSGTG